MTFNLIKKRNLFCDKKLAIYAIVKQFIHEICFPKIYEKPKKIKITVLVNNSHSDKKIVSTSVVFSLFIIAQKSLKKSLIYEKIRLFENKYSKKYENIITVY